MPQLNSSRMRPAAEVPRTVAREPRHVSKQCKIYVLYMYMQAMPYIVDKYACNAFVESAKITVADYTANYRNQFKQRTDHFRTAKL